MVSLAACGHPAVAVPAFREQVLARLEDEGSVLARWFFSAAPSLTPVDLVQLRAIQSHSTGEEEGLPDTLRVWQSPTTADAWMRSLGERLRLAQTSVGDELKMPTKGTPVRTLEEALEAGDWPNESALVSLLRDLCRALHGFHVRGWATALVHPSRVMEVDDKQGLSYGLVWPEDLSSDSGHWYGFARFSGVVVGRMPGPFDSPEAVRGLALTPASDVASLGLLALTVLRQRAVFGAESDFEVLELVRRWRLPDLDSVPMSSGLREVLRQCLQQDPLDRYVDADALSAALARLG